MAEEGWDSQAFVEASGAALHECLPKTHGALMCPLQLLTGNGLLATILGMPATTQPQALAGRELMPAASITSVSEMPAPLMGVKQWHHSSDQGVSTPRLGVEEAVELDEEQPCHKQKEGRPVASSLKENCWDAFSKESELVRVARWAYYKTHQPNYKYKGSYNLS